METYAEISKKQHAQLLKELAESRKTLFDVKYQVVNKQTKSTHEIRNLKKVIARILTALRVTPSEIVQEDLDTSTKKGQNVATSKGTKRTVKTKATK